MDKIAKEIIEKKNVLLKDTADKLEKIGEEMTSLKQENANLKGETTVLADNLEKANEKIAKFEKTAAARKLVEELVEKGQVDPLKVDETIADFVKSPDSIEKISELTSKLTGTINNIGEIIKEDKSEGPIEKNAEEETHTSDEDLARGLIDVFKKQTK